MALHPGLERAEWAVFHGAINEAIPLLDELTDLSGRAQIYQRWLRAVALGACGRYAEALELADQIAPGTPEYSMARSLRGSLLRQLGIHDMALLADREAMSNAATPGAAIEAMTGLAADAVGLQDALTATTMITQAQSLLERVAAAPASAPTWWRHTVRLSWVRCEVALLSSEPVVALGQASAALSTAEAAAAPRHVAKSLLFVGVSEIESGRRDDAIPHLQRSLLLSGTMGFQAVAWPTHAVLAALLQDSDPAAARDHFVSAAEITRHLGQGLPPEIGRTWEQRADILALQRQARDL